MSVERDTARERGAALRGYLAAHLPVSHARSVTALAAAAGLRPTTVTSWWTKGTVPDQASLQRLADVLGVDAADLVGAYAGTPQRSWVFTDAELEALVARAVETGVRRALAARRRGDDTAR